MIAERTEETWQLKAACRGPHAEIFFAPTTPERKEDRMEREFAAKSICQTCSVRESCLDYAIEIREPHGIWGGLNEIERKQLADRRAG